MGASVSAKAETVWPAIGLTTAGLGSHRNLKGRPEKAERMCCNCSMAGRAVQGT